MPYCVLDDVRGPNGALTQPKNVTDQQFTQLIGDAAAMINAVLEIPYDLAPAAAASKTVYGDGTPFLRLPLFEPGTVTTVYTGAEEAVDHWHEAPGGLRLHSDEASLWFSPTTHPWYYGPTGASWYGLSSIAWSPGVPYMVQASFGASADDLAILRRANVELTVQLYRFKDAGGSQVLGTEAGVVNVKNAWSPMTGSQLQLLHDRIHPQQVVM